VVLLACLGLTGCAGWWDEVTAKNYWQNLGKPTPPPQVVLAQSDDGVLRAKALRALKEPGPEGGQEKQGQYLELLGKAAVGDRDSVCRLAAIRTLGKYKDPRAVEILQDAYFKSTTFPPEVNTVLRQAALTSLGQTGSAEARDLLVRVAGQPPTVKEASEVERQMATDERLAAIRALGSFKQYDTTKTLVHILKNERDVAVRDRAHESLQRATGRSLPQDATAWEELLQNPEAVPPEPAWRRIIPAGY
jgi:HEAT repeat protein